MTVHVSTPDIERFLRAQGHTLAQLERGELPFTLDEVKAAILISDPVLWAETMLVNKPEDGGGNWRFFDYQKPSLRFRGDVVHEDAAEVGKTREIVALTLWSGSMQEGGSLVAGAEDGNLDEIWDEIEWQLSQNEWLRDQVDAEKTKVKPYKKLVWRNGNRDLFRPAGHDGRAFRGIHVARRASFDEAAKVENPDVFSEFFRALKPGCEPRIYSVPDGRIGTPFHKLCQSAIPYNSMTPSQRASLSAKGGPRRFVKFNWSKPMMPPPFWTPEREREFIERYNGRDSSGFIRNVLGLWGDPQNSVFPWPMFSPCLRYVEEYVEATILFDRATDTVYVEAHQLNAGYQVRSVEEAAEEDSGPAPMREIYRANFDINNFDIEAVLRRIFTPDGVAKHQVGGADVGKSVDEPTEIGCSEVLGRTRRWNTRLCLKRIDYDQQVVAIRVMDSIRRPDYGWGLDATGNGGVLEGILRGADSRFGDRLTGFVFNTKIDCRNPETGETVVDPQTEKVRRISYKELGTQLLELGIQRGLHQVPWDPIYVQCFPAHTASLNKIGERSFSPHNDHVIDEKRVEELRLFEMEHAVSSPPAVFAVPRNAGRDLTLHRDY